MPKKLLVVLAPMVAACALVAVPVAAQAATAPTVETRAASAIAQTSATMHGVVNPNGSEVTACRFEYGTTTSYGSNGPCFPLAGSGTTPVEVSSDGNVTGLAANTTYHYRIVATNAGGTSMGSDVTFTTLPKPPTLETQPASSVTQTSATLNATVNPNGGEVSECRLEYGTTTAYGFSASCTPSPGSGSTPVAVSASVTGLTANTTYHFRIVATNPGGTSSGNDQPFITLPSGTTHYYSNNVLISSEPRTVEAWGTITLANVKGGVPGGFITCHTAQAGTIANPEGGGAGVGSTQAFATFDCESEGMCAAGEEFALTAQNLPWPSVLTEEVAGTIRIETRGLHEFDECLVNGKEQGGPRFVIGASEKGLRPKVHKGSSAAHPSFLEYGEGSGELEVAGSGGTVTVKAEGSLKFQGYTSQELISTKNP